MKQLLSPFIVVIFCSLAGSFPGFVVPDRKPPDEKDLAKHYINGMGMTFVWISPGTFLMGSPKEEEKRDSGETQHKVTLSKGFYMAVHLVTQDQWEHVMGNNPSKFSGERTLPVDNLSWDDCQIFCKKLQEKESKPYRLPTESEWEYACRAGTTTPFHFGETISTEQANYNSDFTYLGGKKGFDRKKTTPVGSFPANAWGLHDMHGNVWQWCQDYYGDYPRGGVKDPLAITASRFHVARGGSWSNPPWQCRSASRACNGPPGRYDLLGFRICFFVD